MATLSSIITPTNITTASNTQTLTNKTLTSAVIANGLTASGSGANDLSGSTGTFKTPTGANTFGGSLNTFSNEVVLASAGPASSYCAGFRGWPYATQTNYTFVLADAGTLVGQTAGGTHTFTIPPNSSAAFPIGTRIAIWNTAGAGTLTVARGSGVVLRLTGGSNTDADRTVPQATICYITKTSTDQWVIEGSGVA
jgi:hypothetical protein